MSHIATYGKSTILCDLCKSCQISVSREEFTSEEWNALTPETTAWEKALRQGWDFVWTGRTIVHGCPDCQLKGYPQNAS